MELTFEEKLKLDNSKEHLQVVLGNLRIVNNELTEKLKELADVRNSLKDVIEYRDIIIADNTKILSNQSARFAELENKELGLVERENTLDNREDDVNSRILEANNKLEKLKTDYTMNSTICNVNLNSIKAKIFDSMKEFELIQSKIQEYENIANEKSQDISELENERVRLAVRKEEEERALEDFKRKAEREKAIILAEIETEKEKVSIPRQLLLEREEFIERKNKNLETLRLRLQEKYKRFNPGKPVPIELQN